MCRPSRIRRAALLLVLLSLPPTGALAQEAMNADAFVRTLEDLSSRISSTEAGQAPDLRIPAVWTVVVGEQRVEVPATWLSRSLVEAREDPAAWPGERVTILARIEALRLEAQALASETGGDPPAADEARATLGAILARPEYRGMAQQSALDTLRQRVFAWFQRLVERLGASALGGRGTAVALAWLTTILALVVLASWVARLIMRPERNRARLEPPAGGPKSARVWAREALQATDGREAIRCAYRAVVACLEEEGTWRRDPTRTPREYGRLLAPGHRRNGPFAEVARRFEEIWFGGRVATDEDRAAVMVRLKELGCLSAD